MLLWIAFLAFASLGLPDGVLGIAWPSVRATFARPLSQLGVLLAAAMVGYLASAFASGQIVARIGIERLLLWSSVTVAGSSVGYALAPRWPAMVACGVLAGLGAGAIDAGTMFRSSRRSGAGRCGRTSRSSSCTPDSR